MKPNPNLWSVDIKDRKSGNVQLALFVCASTASIAESKASRFARKMGYRSFTVSRVEHRGSIDVF